MFPNVTRKKGYLNFHLFIELIYYISNFFSKSNARGCRIRISEKFRRCSNNAEQSRRCFNDFRRLKCVGKNTIF